MKKYNVIWFDDEFETLNIIKENAAINGIILNGFGNAKDGIEELERNLIHYDAAIVDGKFYNNQGQYGDSMDDSALRDVIQAFFRLEDKKVLPWFILSGQISFTKEKNRYADGFKANKVYDKTMDDHLVSLWNDLKMEADKQLDTQIRHEYSNVFEVCSEQYIGEVAQKPLLKILKSIKEPETDFYDELYFTQIRIILESMFRAANRRGFLHDKCLEGGRVNLSESSLFLSGAKTKHLGVSCGVSHFNKIISEYVKLILFITGAASHTVDPEMARNINLASYRKEVNSPFMLYSLAFQLMDILIWFKSYTDKNPDIEKNKALWIDNPDIIAKAEGVIGTVIQIAENGYGTFEPKDGGKTLSIIPTMVRNYNLSEGDCIEVITKPNSDGTKLLIERILKA